MIEINGKQFKIIENMELGTFIALDEIIRDMFNEKGEIPIENILRFTRDGMKLRRFITTILVPARKPNRLMRFFKKDTWTDLQHIRIDQVIKAISDFFSIRGPLQAAFLGVSAPLMEASKQTPMTTSKQK